MDIREEIEELKSRLKVLEDRLNDREADLINCRKETAKEIFDRLEQNLFYEDNRDIEISFNAKGWEELKQKYFGIK